MSFQRVEPIEGREGGYQFWYESHTEGLVGVNHIWCRLFVSLPDHHAHTHTRWSPSVVGDLALRPQKACEANPRKLAASSTNGLAKAHRFRLVLPSP